MIQGGVKSNALPEQANAVVNHRISTLSSVADVIERDTNTLKGLAEKFNLTFTSFGKIVSDSASASSYGSLYLSDAYDSSLEPAPTTPTSGPMAAPYELLSGTIQATYNAHRGLEGNNNVVVAPGMPSGNTDTRFYWDLSEGQIFRYNHRNAGASEGIPTGVHTVDESECIYASIADSLSTFSYVIDLPIESFLEMIRFFTTLIINTDESRAV